MHRDKIQGDLINTFLFQSAIISNASKMIPVLFVCTIYIYILYMCVRVGIPNMQ